ncbi:MAG: histidinol dehydrogenase [Candidatus Ranarchaeia archaeon]|jgi:histidinol dehydrogenase
MSIPILDVEDVRRSGLRQQISDSMDPITIMKPVEEILTTVCEKGDRSLCDYTQQFDNVSLTPDDLQVPQDRINAAYESMDPSLIRALEHAARNIRKYHSYQLQQEEWWITQDDGIEVGQIVRPLECVGVYVPGGLVPYPSTVLMNVIPAQVAQVKRIVVCSPPSFEGEVHPSVLATCKLLGVTEVFRVGGAQAIAALACGTKRIPQVQKIIGPGNKYVTAAKSIANRELGVAIDLIAGPSECLIIADDAANPRWVTLDLLSQLEHDINSVGILLTPSKDLAYQVKAQIERSLEGLETSFRKHLETAIQNGGRIVVVSSIEEAIGIVNEFAPEHLEIETQNPMEILPQIQNAGAIGIGAYSPVPLTDYGVGVNHVLPTNGTARSKSGLSVREFIKTISVTKANKDTIKEFGAVVVKLAELERLQMHAKSMKARLNK